MNKSFGYYCLRYVGFAVIVTLAIVAVIYGSYAIAPDLAARIFEGGGGTGVGVVSVMLPAMLVAQVFYKHEQRRMTAGEGWSMAIVFTILAFLVSGTMMLISWQLVPLTAAERDELSFMWNDARDVMLIVFAIFAVLLILINKLMLWSGVRGEIKKAERQAAKDARNS